MAAVCLSIQVLQRESPLLSHFPFICKYGKIDILFVNKQEIYHQKDGGDGHADIRKVEHREINQLEINIVDHIMQPYPVDQVSDGTGCKQRKDVVQQNALRERFFAEAPLLHFCVGI